MCHKKGVGHNDHLTYELSNLCDISSIQNTLRKEHSETIIVPDVFYNPTEPR